MKVVSFWLISFILISAFAGEKFNEFKAKFDKLDYLSGNIEGKLPSKERFNGRFFVHKDKLSLELKDVSGGKEFLWVDGKTIMHYIDGNPNGVKSRLNGFNFYFPDSLIPLCAKLLELYVAKDDNGYILKGVSKKGDEEKPFKSMRAYFTSGAIPKNIFLEFSNGETVEIKFKGVSTKGFDKGIFSPPKSVRFIEEGERDWSE